MKHHVLVDSLPREPSMNPSAHATKNDAAAVLPKPPAENSAPDNAKAESQDPGRLDRELDEALEETFPASDPPAIS